MGLKNTIINAVDSGFKAAGDVKVNTTFVEVTGTGYNPVTGEVVETVVEYPNIYGFIRQYSIREIEVGIAQAGDMRLVVQAKDIGFSPITTSRVKIDGKTYNIQDFSADPVGATMVFRLRTAE